MQITLRTSCILSVVVLSVFVPRTFKGSEDSKWEASDFCGGRPVELKQGRYSEVVVFNEANPTVGYGPVFVWFEGTGSPGIQVTGSLANLDELLRKEEHLHGVNAALQSMLPSILARYRGVRRYSSVQKEDLPVYLKNLQKSVNEEQFRLIKEAFSSDGVCLEGDKWSVSYVVISDRRGIERWRFEGRAKPFCVSGESVELLAANGSTPVLVDAGTIRDDK